MRIPLTDPQRRAGQAMTVVDVRRRLSDPELPRRAADLGFRDPDVADLMNVVQPVLHSEDHLAGAADTT